MRTVMPTSVRELRKESRSASRFTGRRVHFIGIGGCGMSGLARMLLDAGAIVTGSEPNLNTQTCELANRGVVISGNQIGELIHDDTDLVVRTAAVPDSNVEFCVARRKNIATIKYAELLGQVMAERRGIAVAGTHGKSTTTAMIAFALAECGADPSFVVGGTVPQLGSAGSRSGGSDLFVAEACEFDRSFHALRPKVAMLLNIEEDHLDCYKNLDEIIESFRTFAKVVPAADGLIIANGRDANVAKAVAGLQARVETVSLAPGTTWSTCPSGIGADGLPTGAVWHNGEPVGMLNLAVAGEHNLMNATMALAACVASGVDAERAIEALGRFKGVDRRMTEMGHVNGATVVDDYGHHPTEIRATLAALRQRYNPKRLICVFQPHQHSRTRFLLEDFATSFAAADETIVPDIYFVRDSEDERQAVSAADLVERVRRNGQKALHLPAFEQIVEHLKREARQGDLIVTMGAGNVWEIGRELVS
jgi:UDP-N-acetylmuramate--alanine ligase